MSDTNVEIGITADDSGLIQGFSNAKTAVEQGSAEIAASIEGMAGDITAASSQAAAAINVIGESAEAQTARIRSMVAASLAQVEANGGITLSERALREAMGERTVATAAQTAALQAQIAAQTAAMVSVNEYMGAEAAVVAENGAVAESSAVAAAGITEVGVASSAATRELGVMAGEAMRGNFARLEQSTVTLANRTGLLAQVFTPIGALVAGMAAGLFLLGDAMYKDAEEMARFNSVAELAGSTSARTGEQLQSLAKEVAGISGKADEAGKAVQSLAMSGKFAGDTLDQAARGAAAFADLTGTKIEQAVAEFEKLGQDPVKALIDLDSKTHMVDSSIVALVARAQEQGNTFAAATIATQALSRGLQEADTNAKKFAEDHSALNTFSMSVSDAAAAEAGLGQTLIFDRQKADEAAEAHKRLSDARAIVGNAAQNSVNMIIEALTKEKDKLDEVTATYGKGKVGLAEYTIAKAEAALKSIALTAAEQTFFEELKNGVNILQAGRDAYNAYTHTLDASKGTLADIEAGLLKSAKAADAQKAAVKDANEGIKEFADQELALAEQLDAMSTDLQGRYAQAWAKYSESFDKVEAFLTHAADLYKRGKISLEEYNADVQIGHDLEAQYALTLDETNKKLDEQGNIVGHLHSKLEENTRLLAATGIAHKELEAIIQAENEARKLYEQHLRDTPDLTDKEREHILQDVDAHHQMDEAIKNSQEIMKGWVSIGANGLDQFFGTLNKDIIEGGNLMKDLANVWKSVVEAILLQAEKLLIINPILNSIFGTAAGGGNYLPALLGVGSGSGGGAGGGLGSIMNLFGGGGGGLTVDTAGLNAGMPSEAMFGGGGVNGASQGMFGGGFGGVMPILGGAAAAFGEYNAAGGGLGGAAGAAAYGIGTATLISAAGTAMSAGIAAGMAAIPVVGWIALAAMGINMLTGGGLFGTAWKVTGGEQDLNIGPNGVSAQDLTNESRKRAFFGGTAHRTITKDDAAATASLQDFATQLQAGLDSFMAQFGDQTAQIVAGTFKTTFDKHGKATGTSDTVLGVTRTGETAEQFTQRIQADSFLAALDKMGLGASKFVEGLQGDTQKLLAAVQDFAATTQVANANVAAGFKFLALGADQSLKSVMLFVEGLNHGGETLSQTYQRLAQAQAQYNQFVGQFAQAPTYVDPFEASVAQLRDQMKQAEAQANALAEAAGASGASLDDLDNIQRKYQQGLASLTAQLQANAQSLAFSLGLTTMGSLDQIDAEIKALEGSTTSASTSLSQFGGAVHDVAAKTNAALDLMLGNLSPLNDQQKLQYALQGLHAGTVSADTVLGIGRSLYASSEAYNVLFNQVLPYAGQKGQGGGGYTGTASSIQTNNSNSTLSPEDQAKLDELKRQRDILEKQQQLNQFQTLAQQVAEIAQAKGETVDQVLADMGISLKDLEKGLGIANDEDFKAYMEGLQKQTDSNGDNTRSIVAAIDALPSKLAQILGLDGRGQQPGTATSTTDRSQPVTGTTRSVGQKPDTGQTAAPSDISPESVKAIGKAFYNAIMDASRDTAQPNLPRNLRAMGVF